MTSESQNSNTKNLQTHAMKNPPGLLPLLLILAIDCMGFGFIFPVLTPLFLHGHHAIVPANISVPMKDFLYGLVVAVYPFCMFFGAPILGDLSDKIGRKRVLLICLLGTAIGYLISGVGVAINSFSLLMLGRIIDGLTAGSLALAQAAIADISTDETQRAKFMGWMMLAIAGGQVLGPLFSGLFSDTALSGWFTHSLPFYLAAVLSFINTVWLVMAFKETYQVNDYASFNITKTLYSYRNIFTMKGVFSLSIIFLCMQIAWSFYSQATPAYLQHTFSFGNFQLGLFSSVLGIFIAVGGSYIMPRLHKKMSTPNIAMLGMVLIAVGVLVSVLLNSQVVFWIGVMITSIAAALAFTQIITLFSLEVDETKQGWVMGITGAIIALGWAISAILSGVLLVFSYTVALYIAVVVALLGAVVLRQFNQRKAQAS